MWQSSAKFWMRWIAGPVWTSGEASKERIMSARRQGRARMWLGRLLGMPLSMSLIRPSGSHLGVGVRAASLLVTSGDGDILPPSLLQSKSETCFNEIET
jgi:hypothetical protein